MNLLPEDIRAAERELSRARETYAAVVGLAGRMYWRRKFEEAQEHVSVLREKAGETPAVQTGVGV